MICGNDVYEDKAFAKTYQYKYKTSDKITSRKVYLYVFDLQFVQMKKFMLLN